MIQTVQVQGTEKRLYRLVAPLVMDPEVLRMNNNYPFKTTGRYIWFIAIDGKKVTGFIPIEKRNTSHVINNYYVGKEGDGILRQLLADAIAAINEEKPWFAVALTEHKDVFEEYGFVVEKEWKRYAKMRKD